MSNPLASLCSISELRRHFFSRSFLIFLLIGGETAGDAPPENPPFAAALFVAREGGFLLSEGPEAGDAPVIDGKTVAGAQTESGEIQPACFMRRGTLAGFRPFDEFFPEGAQQR